MAHKTAVEQKGIPVVFLVVALVVILGAGFFLYLDRASHRPPPPPAPLTAEAKAYVHSLQLMDVDMQKHESYMKQAVVEITGKIANNGSRNLRVVEINCVFYDPDGQLVLRKSGKRRGLAQRCRWAAWRPARSRISAWHSTTFRIVGTKLCRAW